MRETEVSRFSWESELNPEQLEAVTTIEGPLLVIAGAGTGKTRVIEYRVLYMVQQGIDPRSILLLTFTRRAAAEMISRAARHDRRSAQVVGGTFHSFGYAVLERYAPVLGLRRPFSFLDEADSEEVLSRLAARLGFYDQKERFPAKGTLRDVISASFNRGQTVEEVLLRDYPQHLRWTQAIERLKEEYVRYKLEHSMVDYDDLLLLLDVLLDNEKVRKELSGRYRYLMVDEYQDTNRIQARIVYKLAGEHRNVMVVGDDAQSIYGFRGARFENMFEFLEVFPDARVVRLERNYRSTQPILDLANAVMLGAKRKYTKVLRAVEQGGEKPRLLIFRDPQAEAEWVAAKVKELWDEGLELARMAVLFRSMYLARPLELALSKRGIPYRTYGGLRFSETAHVKDVLCHLRVLLNPRDEIAWYRVLMLVEGIGPKTAERLASEIGRTGLWQAALGRQAQGRAARGLKALLLALEEAGEKKAPSEVLEAILTYYEPVLKKTYDDYPRRQWDLEALRQIAASYRSLEEFLLDLVTLEPPERVVEERQDERLDTRPLVLSTIHSAKGLEWDAVFIIGLADGHLPLSYSVFGEEELEEERRLLYVAITRARRLLYLTMAHEGRKSFLRLSRFLQSEDVKKCLDIAGSELLEGEGGSFSRQDLVRRILDVS